MENNKKEIIPYNKSTQEYISERTVGKKYNRLTIKKVIGKSRTSHGAIVKARCDCGNYAITYVHDIKRGHTKSCGCLKKELNKIGKSRMIHGESRRLPGSSKEKGEYRTWVYIRGSSRKNNDGRFQICKRWMEPNKGYLNFIEDVGRKPEGLSVFKRIDKTKEYCKENCKWIVTKKRTLKGKADERICYNTEG
jgi:hypothetical protein